MPPEAMPPASKQAGIIDLHFGNREGKVRVTLPDQHVMILAVEAAVRACGAFKDQVEFQAQYNLLLDKLAEWIESRLASIHSAYITARDGGILFVVVRSAVLNDADFEDALTDLDIDVANDSDFSLIQLSVIALPKCSDEAVASFLAPDNSLRFRADG